VRSPKNNRTSFIADMRRIPLSCYLTLSPKYKKLQE
jgi:hypothetical protein